ncbi:MAG: hypothetical protein LBF50_06895, partial [Azoarcus sp.]|nr:hypothetical protein [Azoarcus sp.]
MKTGLTHETARGRADWGKLRRLAALSCLTAAVTGCTTVSNLWARLTTDCVDCAAAPEAGAQCEEQMAAQAQEARTQTASTLYEVGFALNRQGEAGAAIATYGELDRRF